MNEIEFYEKKEDIEEGLMQTYNQGLDYLDVGDKKIPYVSTRYGLQVSLEEGEKNFNVKIYKNGYRVEHPSLTKLENKEYDVEEFLSLIEEVNKNPYDMILSDETLLEKGNLRFIGMNVKLQSTWDDCSSFPEEYEKNTRLAYIIYAEEIKENSYENKEIYRIEAIDDYGMCGSGYTTASWGTLEVTKVDYVDEYNLIITPEENLEIRMERTEDEFEKEEFHLNIIDIDKDIVPLKVVCDYDGGDSYYPMGGVYITTDKNEYLNLSDMENIPDLPSLKIDKEKLEKARNEKEIFDLGNPKIKENETDDLEF